MWCAYYYDMQKQFHCIISGRKGYFKRITFNEPTFFFRESNLSYSNNNNYLEIFFFFCRVLETMGFIQFFETMIDKVCYEALFKKSDQHNRLWYYWKTRKCAMNYSNKLFFTTGRLHQKECRVLNIIFTKNQRWKMTICDKIFPPKIDGTITATDVEIKPL